MKCIVWLIVLECLLVTYLIFIFLRITGAYLSLSKELIPSPFDRLTLALKRVIKINAVHRILVSELSLLYYALFARTDYIPREATSFSYAKTSQFKVLAIVVVILVTIEAILVHILLSYFLISKYDALWLKAIPWILHAGELYLMMFLVAHYRAMKLLPYYIDGKQLTIQYGVLGRADIPLSTIASIQKARDQGILDKEEKQTFYAHFTMDTPQLELLLNEDITMTTLFGKQKKINKIVCHLDEPAHLQQVVNDYMERSEASECIAKC